MMSSVRSRAVLAMLAIALMSTTLMTSGCGTKKAAEQKPATTPAAAAKPAPIKIGTLATEDSLPLWVAEDAGYFKDAGITDFEIVVFQSAQERDAAFSAGAIQAFMGDMIAATNLEAGGTPVTILTVMLGADPSQGRFGVAVPPKSSVTKLTQLAGVPVGTSSATIQEYVLDGLMSQAGVAEDKVKKEEVKKVPVRFELLMKGQLKAAALPEPFLSLAEKGGARIVGDDTKSKANLTQTVLVVSDKYMRESGGTLTADAVLTAWDKAAADINSNPSKYMPVLVEKARLPKPLEGVYKMQTYPEHKMPSQAEVDSVLNWMTRKGYLKKQLTYTDLTLVLPE